MTTTPRQRAVIYCRVSTDKQEIDGESLEYQEAKCRQYAELHEISIITVLKEVKSGFIHYSHRYQLTIARQLIRDRLADMVIVWDLRRFSRNFVHSAMIFAEIESNGGSIVSVSENIDNSLTGKLIRSILAWSAESEREKIMEYANRRWQTRLELGLPVGTGYTAYGWDWGDADKTTYVINPEEAAVRFSIFHMFVELDMSLRSIAHKLTEDGIPTPTQVRYPHHETRGQLWNHTTLFDFLRDPANIGTLVICKRRKVLDEQGKLHREKHPETRVIPNGLPAIIPLNLYERAQRKLASNQVEQSHKPEKEHLYLLRGHIKCATCGHRMSMRMVKRRNKQWPIYYCANRRNKYGKCPDIPVVRADLADRVAWAEICQIFERLEHIQAKLEAEVQKSLTALLEDNKGTEQTASLKAEIDHARQEQLKHEKGSYYYDLIAEDIHRKTEQLEKFETAYTNSRDYSLMQQAYRNRLLSFLDFVNVMRGKYASATFQEKRNALDVLGVKVVYTPRKPEERRRGVDATVAETRQRLTITYSPIFTGVDTSVDGRPQNQ
jgi:DNA invertase Pin-like site-specific DNA recombinase